MLRNFQSGSWQMLSPSELGKKGQKYACVIFEWSLTHFISVYKTSEAKSLHKQGVFLLVRFHTYRYVDVKLGIVCSEDCQ